MTVTSVQIAPEIGEARGLAVLYLGTGRGDRAPIADRLSKMGLAVTRTGELGEALDALGARSFAVCVVDLSEDRTAVPWIRAIRAHHPQAAIIGVIDPSRPLAAADAMQAGAGDLLSWPFHEAEVTAMVTNLRDQAAATGPDAAGHVVADLELVAHSPAMRQVVDLVRAASCHSDGVWLSGESGAGRETVARAIHAASPRAFGPFVVMDFADGATGDVDERLFGVAADSEPAAGKSRALDRIGPGGALYRAQGGVLFLRHITAAPARVQAKLARLIRDGEAQDVDRRVTMMLDARLFVAGEDTAAATLASGHLRRELHDRVSHTSIEVPPLRRRREDIPALAVSLLGELCEALGATRQQFSRAALTVLSVLPWPGNGRELRTLVDTMVRSVERPVIQLDDVLAHVRLGGASPRVEGTGSLRDARARFEREWISSALMKHQGRVEDAAKALGIQRTNLYRKIRQLNVARALLVRKS